MNQNEMDHLESLLERRKQPSALHGGWGVSVNEMQDKPSTIGELAMAEQMKRERAEKLAAHEAFMARTVGSQLDERIAALQEQLDSMTEMRRFIEAAGLSGMKVELMKQLIY